MAINFNQVPKYIRSEIDPPEQVIEQGNRGNHVKQIQEWLNFHRCRTGVDADFGPATRDCVKDFQNKSNLPSTGKVDITTWHALVKPMTDALLEPANLSTMNAGEAVLAVANQHVNQNPFEIGGANCGPWVRLYCEGHDGAQWAWCAGFVTFIMHQAYFYRDQKTPIKGSVSCDTLAAQAIAAGLFVNESDITSERVKWDSLGECGLFLRRRTSTDWTHTGFFHGGTGPVRELVFSTIEGNTNDEGGREGFEACRRKRSVNKGDYDFVKFE